MDKKNQNPKKITPFFYLNQQVSLLCPIFLFCDCDRKSFYKEFSTEIHQAYPQSCPGSLFQHLSPITMSNLGHRSLPGSPSRQHYPSQGSRITFSNAMIMGSFLVALTNIFRQAPESHVNATVRVDVEGTMEDAIRLSSQVHDVDNHQVLLGPSLVEPNKFTLDVSRYKIDPEFQEEYDRIDNEDPIIKCARYGFTYNSTNNTIAPKKRRIFFGGLVSDDNFVVVRAHAAEAYGLYHLISLTESNSTFKPTPRELRFAPGTEGYDLLHSGIFGPTTAIHVNLFLGDAGGAQWMEREYMQRDTIVEAWIAGGMKLDDIGLVADMDETFSRDFLLAAQMCDIPEFVPGNDCRAPKLVGDGQRFESSVECMSTKRWYHPDMMMGECIMGVGLATGRILPPRSNGHYGERIDVGYGKLKNDFIEEHKTLNRYPLHTATDFRTVDSGRQYHWVEDHPIPNNGPKNSNGTAYHFHNFFTDVATLRNKYTTYGHGMASKKKVNLPEVALEVDMVIRCIKGLPNEVKKANVKVMDRYISSFVDMKANKPIFFLKESNRKDQHKRIVAMIAEEEKRQGKFYNDAKTS